MSWTDGIDDSGFGEFGYGNVAQDNAVAAIGEAMAGAQGMGGPIGPSSQSGEDARDESNNPTFSFTSGKQLEPQIAQQQSFVNGLKAFMGLSPTKMGMSFLARMGDLTPTMSFMAGDPRANAPITTAGIPGYLGQNYGAGTITDVAMTGSGAHLAPATAIENWGGQNVHVGPGYPMDENFYPGYGVNRYSGVAAAEGGGDPYIRKRRGTEIAGMVGP